MPALTQEQLKELLKGLKENIERFIKSYRTDRKKVKLTVEIYLGNIQNGIVADISKDLQTPDLNPSLTIYDGYLKRLNTKAEDGSREGSGIFFKDDELLIFSKYLKQAVSDFTSFKSEFLDSLDEQKTQEQKAEQTNEVGEIKAQLKILTEQVQLSNEKVQTSNDNNEKLSKQLTEALTELKTTRENLNNLGQLLQLINVEVNDEQTQNALIAAFQVLQLPAPNTLKLTNQPAPATTSLSKFYVPFPEFSESEFAIEGFDVSLFQIQNKSGLASWKKEPENFIAYEKLKLSECLYADMYAAIIMLGQLLKKHNSQNQYANYQPDSKLINAIKSVISKLIENWDKAWVFCKENIIIPALNTAPSLLIPSLKQISSFDHANNVTHTNLYASKEQKIQALLSVICYKDLKEELHFLPKITEPVNKLQQQQAELQKIPAQESVLKI